MNRNIITGIATALVCVVTLSAGCTPAKAGTPGWELRSVKGQVGMAAVHGPGVVTGLTLFCDRGTAYLTMMVKAPPPSGPVTLGLATGGDHVELPLRQGNPARTLWLADVGHSRLPMLLAAHEGTAQLRINGGLQGDVPLANAAASVREALSACYRFATASAGTADDRGARVESTATANAGTVKKFPANLFRSGYYVDADTPCEQASNATVTLIGRAWYSGEIDWIRQKGPKEFEVHSTGFFHGDNVEIHQVVRIDSPTRISSWNPESPGEVWHQRYCPQRQLPYWQDADIRDIDG